MQLQQKRILLFAAIILISLNLRPPLTAVGPLVQEIRMDTGLSNSVIGFLTTLPILAFGFFSVLTALFTRKMGTSGTMAFALLLLTAGTFFRMIPTTPALFIGTGILGIGIALGNVLLPGIVKERFADSAGWLTGAYSAMLALGASVASGISVPLSQSAGFGWRMALGIWGFLSLLALFIWLPQLKQNRPALQKRSFFGSLRKLGSSSLAWHISVFMGLQSLSFYILVAWLPEILIERGMSASQAGWMLAIKQAVGVIGTFALPAWAARRENQRLPVAIIVVLELIALAGLMAPGLHLAVFWVSILGFCMGASFGMALLFIVLRTRGIESANSLSGMSQSIGYTLAAGGPVLFGALHDVTSSWLIPLSLLFVVSIAKLISGWQSGENAFVD